MITTLALVLAAGAMDTQIDYSGLPVLESVSDYRIVTESVEAVVDPATRGTGTVQYNSTTQYRNLGAVGKVTIIIPRYRQGDGVPDFPVTATWDNVNVDLKPSTVKYGFLEGTANFVAQGTHALRVSFQNKLVKSGYANTQRRTQYELDGNHSVELFTMSYKYAHGTTFGLPTMSPDLGWQIGEKGASTRQQSFEPGGRTTSFVFYPTGF